MTTKGTLKGKGAPKGGLSEPSPFAGWEGEFGDESLVGHGNLCFL